MAITEGHGMDPWELSWLAAQPPTSQGKSALAAYVNVVVVTIQYHLGCLGFLR